MSPSLILSLLLGSIVGLLAHSLLGRRLWQLPCFWVSGVAGWLAGEVFAVLAGVEFFRLGNIPLLLALGGALLGVFVCWFFVTLPGVQSQPRDRPQATRREVVKLSGRETGTESR